MKSKNKKLRLCVVTWIDAVDLDSSLTWMTRDEIRHEVDIYKPIIKSVGYAMGTRSGHIVLAGSYQKAIKSHEEDAFTTIQLIPAKWVQDIKYLED